MEMVFRNSLIVSSMCSFCLVNDYVRICLLLATGLLAIDFFNFSNFYGFAVKNLFVTAFVPLLDQLRDLPH